MSKRELVGSDKDCLGCGKHLWGSNGMRSHAWLGATIRFGGNKEAQVCQGRREGQPSKVCELKAREKAALCPGCGGERTSVGEICRKCADAIDRDGTAQARTNLEWWAIAGKKIAPGLSFKTSGRGDHVYPTEELAALLAAALVAGRGPVSRDKLPGWVDSDHYVPHGSDTHYDGVQFIEITPDAGAALKQLVAKLREVMQLQYGDGFRDGSDALGRLSVGDSTVHDFERYKDEVDRRCGRPRAAENQE